MIRRSWFARTGRSLSDRELGERADRSLTVLVISASATLVVALGAFVAIVVALWLTTNSARASDEFACRGLPFVHAQDKAAFAKHAPNGTMRAILIEYAHLWDAAEMKRLCDAKLRGEPVELTCLQGRRSWDAIIADVPRSVLGSSGGAQREHLATLRAERATSRPHQQAMNHCVRKGAVDGIVQE